MRQLFLLCSLFLPMVSPVVAGDKREAVDFSIHQEDSPRIVQGGGVKQTREMPDFSIHSASQDSPISEGIIDFSVHNFQDKSEQKKGDDPLSLRRANRVLVIYHSKPITKTTRVKVCVNGVCHYEDRVIKTPPTESVRFVGALTLWSGEQTKWRCGINSDDHFKLVDASDPKNSELLGDLGVSKEELPLLIKETQPDQRKRATGLSGEDAAKWWNSKFQEAVAPEAIQGVEKVTPGGFLSGPKWDYHGQGTLRQHLMDLNAPHHLPKAVVDGWSDAEVQWWHNWHHEVLEGRKAVKQQTPITQQKSIQGQTTKAAPPMGRGVSRVSLGYSSGSFEGQVSSFAFAVAQQTARAPPAQNSFGSDPKKAEKAQKKWKHDERKRIRKEVSAQVWSEYSTFDPFTILTILSIIIRVLSFIFDQYGLN